MLKFAKKTATILGKAAFATLKGGWIILLKFCTFTAWLAAQTLP